MAGSSPNGKQIYLGKSKQDTLDTLLNKAEHQISNIRNKNIRALFDEAIGTTSHIKSSNYTVIDTINKLLEAFPVFAMPKTSNDHLSQVEQEANARYIALYLLKAGWSKQAIAALLGNIQEESQMNPGAWQDKNNSGGYGLVQWDPASKFLNYAFKGRTPEQQIQDANYLAVKNPKKLMNLQLEYLLKTMQPGAGEWAPDNAIDRYGANKKFSYNEFITSNSTIEELTEVFVTHYERPKAYDRKPKKGKFNPEAQKASLDIRIAAAEEWYKFLFPN